MIAIAIALSMDAFGVSMAIDKRYVFKASFSFGSFQAIMPIIGWFIGIELKKFIASIDHWIAFIILSVIGIKIIYESEDFKSINIILLSIATSIDAFAVGITLSFIGIAIFLPALIIGIITFFICLLGFSISKRIGISKMVGGIILIAIGIKILVEHLIKLYG